MNDGNMSRSAVDLPRIDQTDRRIIGELSTDGRVSIAELGRRVNLSAPAVAGRVQRLERAGVITGYRAELDPRALGFPLTAIVRVKPSVLILERFLKFLAEQRPGDRPRVRLRCNRRGRCGHFERRLGRLIGSRGRGLRRRARLRANGRNGVQPLRLFEHRPLEGGAEYG